MNARNTADPGLNSALRQLALLASVNPSVPGFHRKGWVRWGFSFLFFGLMGFPLGSMAAAEPSRVVLTEFMAMNTRTLKSDLNTFDDWIEIQNQGSEPVNLSGWSMGNHTKRSRAWFFPSTNLPPGAVWLIWASGKNRRTPGAPLHTHFKLSGSGEPLALWRPDGSVASGFLPSYPPQTPDVSYGFLEGVAQPVFFPFPTPGKTNDPGTHPVGPQIVSVTHTPLAPEASDPIRITARVVSIGHAITNVELSWRVQFHRPTSTSMQLQPDGTWSATLPADSAEAGQILRWRVLASDDRGAVSEFPIGLNPQDSSKYLGTCIANHSVTSALPVFQLFLPTQRLRSADSEAGARGCFVYDGEFYDNVFVKVRGNTTAGFPKKSHRLEFPHDHPLRHPGPGGRVRHTSLMAEYGDPTYLRQAMSFLLQSESGTAAPFHYPVRVQLNGEFWQLAMHSEVLGEEFLERHGLDPRGALYKAVGTLTPDESSTGGFEKKTRRQEDDQDYLTLARGLSSRSVETRRATLFNTMNVPAVVNYLAMARLTQEDDDIWANMSLYRDSDGNGEWRPVAFDMNVSFGLSYAYGGIEATNDAMRSHPFFGAANVGAGQGVNRLYDTIVRMPDTRAMLVRRMRTMMDQFWQPPGTPVGQRWIEQRLQSWAQSMASDAVLDRQKWGLCWYQSPGTPKQRALFLGIQEMIDTFLEPRREHFYVHHSLAHSTWAVGASSRHSAGIPDAQRPGLTLSWVQRSASDAPVEQQYLVFQNPQDVAVDLSGWKLSGRIRFSFPPGCVLAPGAEVVVARDRTAYRRWKLAQNGGAAVFVVGDFDGAWNEFAPLTLTPPNGESLPLKMPSENSKSAP